MANQNEAPGPARPALPILIIVGIAAVTFVAGMLVESQLAARTAAEVRATHEQEAKAAAERAELAARKAEEEKQQLNETIAKERKDHENAIQAKDRSIASVSGRAAGVQHALEADLSAARGSGDACLARVTRISEALGGFFQSVGEVAGIAQDLGRENEQLKADNQSLAQKLAGWQKWNAERNSHIIINAQKEKAG